MSDDPSLGGEAGQARDGNGGARHVMRVTDLQALPDAPPPELRYRRELEVFDAAKRLFLSRTIIAGLIVRQIRSQYSQQFLGIAWAIITPFAQALLFSVLLGKAGKDTGIDLNGVPRVLFFYGGLLAWSFFAGSVQSAGNSLVGNPLLNKVYAPREVFPLAQIASSGVNALAGVLVLPALFLVTAHGPTATAAWTPMLFIPLVAVTTAWALVVAAITVYLRDLRSGLPLLVQLGMFSPGVLYPMTAVIDGPWRLVYTAILPIGPIVEEIRSTFLLGQSPDFAVTLTASISAVVYLCGCFVFFKRLETGFADVS